MLDIVLTCESMSYFVAPRQDKDASEIYLGGERPRGSDISVSDTLTRTAKHDDLACVKKGSDGPGLRFGDLMPRCGAVLSPFGSSPGTVLTFLDHLRYYHPKAACSC